MKTNTATITDIKIARQIIAARCLGNLSFVLKKVNIGSSKTANKNAIKTGVRISFPMQKINAKQIKETRIKESFA
ncbi:hypothetical protein GCM10022422_24160 [Flavobacterium ginsengisoli]|uniref:Uncharacterized protein n=1 Tax=Flavobacterium ginsengisoli TaxID=871694 RepID=A0ABP7FH85_9FLAO